MKIWIAATSMLGFFLAQDAAMARTALANDAVVTARYYESLVARDKPNLAELNLLINGMPNVCG